MSQFARRVVEVRSSSSLEDEEERSSQLDHDALENDSISSLTADGTSGEHGNTSGGSAHGAAPLRNSDSTASALTSLRRSIEDLKSKRKQNTQNLLDLKSNIKELRKDTDKLLKFQTKSMIAKM